MSTLVKIGIGAGIGILALSLTAGQFTTLKTGENGLYVGFDGQVKDSIIQPGIHFDGLGSIKTFNTRKITVASNDLRPKTKDNTIMKDMDVVVTYAINPGSLYRFYTDYDMSNHDLYRNGQIQLMSNYIGRLIASAVNQSVDEFPALEVNSSLDRIQEVIKTNLQAQLAKNGLDTGIQVESVVAVKADLPDTLVDSVNRVVAAQSDKKEKTVRNETILLTQQTKTDAAKLKAEENKALESSITPRYLEYQRNEIMKEAFANGQIEKMIIVNGSPLEMLPTGKIGN